MPISLYLVFACLLMPHGAASLAVSPWRVLLAIAMVTASPIVLAILQALEMNRMPGNATAALRRRTLLQFSRLHLIAWSIASLAGVWLMHWPTLVGFISTEYRLSWAEGLIQVLPAALSLSGSWFAQLWLAPKVDPALIHCRIDRGVDSLNFGARAFRLVFLIIVPLWVLFLVERWMATQAFSNGTLLVVLAGAVGLVVILLPVYLKFALRSEPFAIPSLEDAGRWEIRQWHTGRSIHNAMLAGFLPGLRTIYISDGLIQYFSEAELAAIVRHEIAHATQHHALLRLASLFPPIAAGTWLWQSTVIDVLPLLLLLVLATASYVFVVVRSISHWIEFEADRISTSQPQLGQSIREERQRDLSSALEKLAEIFPDLRCRSTLFHPSLKDRLSRLTPISKEAAPEPLTSQGRV